MTTYGIIQSIQKIQSKIYVSSPKYTMLSLGTTSNHRKSKFYQLLLNPKLSHIITNECHVCIGDEHTWRLTHGNCINCTTFVQVTSLFDFPPSLLPQADHSFHVPIASSVNSTPHGIDQHPAITYQEVLFIHKIGTLHTQYSFTQPQLPRVQLQ
jgi:hypothetical protein